MHCPHFLVNILRQGTDGWALCMLLSTMLAHKLHSGTSKTDQLTPDKPEFPSFCKSTMLPYSKQGQFRTMQYSVVVQRAYLLYICCFIHENNLLTYPDMFCRKVSILMQLSKLDAHSLPVWYKLSHKKYFSIDDHFTLKLTFSLLLLYHWRAVTPLCTKMHVIIK